MSSRFAAHICRFTEGLDELSRKKQHDLKAVLTFLAEVKRFSVFEATANQTIAKTMDTLTELGLFRVTGGSYPWCEIEITERGQRFLDGTLSTAQAIASKPPSKDKTITLQDGKLVALDE